MLTDSYGRTLDYLRLSITDRCNLRCVYCMPKEGIQWKPHGSILEFEEILRLCRILIDLGIRKIRVTGGEPLVRKGAASLIKSLKGLPGLEKLTLTTNGVLLGSFINDEVTDFLSLIDGVNISLDALDPGRYNRITGTDATGNTGIAGPSYITPLLDRLLERQIPVKINCVPVRDYNEEEIIPIAALAREKNIAVRFIELMPLGIASALKPIPGTETAVLLEKAFGALSPLGGIYGSGPAVYYSLPGFKGMIGFINPISCGFCESCNRLRLSSEGKLKPCLSSETALDLRSMLRSGSSDEEIALAISETAAKKPRFHTFSETESRHPTGMFRIGG